MPRFNTTPRRRVPDPSGPRQDIVISERTLGPGPVGGIRRCLRPEWLIPLFVYLAASIWFIQNQYSLFDFPLDDAWIHRVYARSLAMGHGLAYNPGQQETGSTSPLWIIASAPAHWLEFLGTRSMVVGVKLIGWLFGAAVMFGVVRLSQLLTKSGFVACLAGSLMALEARLLFSALSGMETTLLVAIWIWACVALLEKRYMAFLLLLGLAPLARPEALLLTPLALLAVPGVVRGPRSPWLKLAILALPLIPQLLWSATCMLINRHPLPITFFLKAEPFELGTAELVTAWRGLTQQGLPSLLIYPLGMLAFLGFCLRWRSRVAWQCLALLPLAGLVYLLGVCGTRTVVLEGYYWTRWLDPGALVLSVPFCVGFSLLVWTVVVGARGLHASMVANGTGPTTTTTKRRQRRELALRIAAGVLTLAFVAISAPQFRRTMLDRRSHMATDSRAITIINVQMGEWIHDNTPPNAVVGVNDAGAIRYFGERKTIDLIGLNNSEIAFGGLSMEDAVRRCDWLAFFPAVLPEEILQVFRSEFDLRKVIQIPLEEYTICLAKEQTVELAMQRKGPRPAGS
jgi:hypothetical protein